MSGPTRPGSFTGARGLRRPAGSVQKRPDFVLWDADKQVIPSKVGLIYEVERAEQNRLLLSATGEGVRGWTLAVAVMPLGQAESFFSWMTKKYPASSFGFLMRGIVRAENDDLDRALADLDEAMRLDPKLVAALIQRARVRRFKNQLDLALADANKAIELDQDNAGAYAERGVISFSMKEQEKGLRDFDQAIRLGSKSVIIYVTRGKWALEKKDPKKAYAEFVHALQIDPKRHDAYLGLASTHLMRGEYKKAQALLDEAVQVDSNNPEAYGNRAVFHLARGHYEQALFNLDEVIRLAPTSARALRERAWLLATCPEAKYRDGAKAVESAKRACELTEWKKPRYLATLAAAYSEAGDFDQAVKAQERAIALLGRNASETTEYATHLARYKSKKPGHRLSLLDEIGIRGLQPKSR